jgi:hypothetical protein
MISKRKQVVLTPYLESIVSQIEPHTGAHVVRLTSGVRTALEQVGIIAYWALKMGVNFPEFDPHDLHGQTEIEGKLLYRWQRTWSKLLNLGIIVNPPLAAVCLEDYIVNGHNKKGEVIHESPHQKSTALDFVCDEGVDVMLGIVKKAKVAGVPIRGYRVERKQYCVHTDVVPEVPK